MVLEWCKISYDITIVFNKKKVMVKIKKKIVHFKINIIKLNVLKMYRVEEQMQKKCTESMAMHWIKSKYTLPNVSKTKNCFVLFHTQFNEIIIDHNCTNRQTHIYVNGWANFKSKDEAGFYFNCIIRN